MGANPVPAATWVGPGFRSCILGWAANTVGKFRLPERNLFWFQEYFLHLTLPL